MKPTPIILATTLILMNPASATKPTPIEWVAATATNTLGLELFLKSKAGNDLISPYSIQSALAMTYAGAAGDTKTEMEKTLHYLGTEAETHESFSTLQVALNGITKTTTELAARAKAQGGSADPVVFAVANRLFGEQTYQFRSEFLELVKTQYEAPLQPVDFLNQADKERTNINAWVEKQTQEKIKDLIPPNGLDRETALVLVNAVYMKAPWANEFSKTATKPEPFHVDGTSPKEVPTMRKTAHFGYTKFDGFQAVTLPYFGNSLHLLVLLPDTADGLPELEKSLTAEKLHECRTIPSVELDLHLPKFKITPPMLALGGTLQAMGMPTAFNKPEGSANFDRMAPRKPDDYLAISNVFHKTFIEVDEQGTEAAAATAVAMMRCMSMVQKPKPIEVKIDRPFWFAIQHRESGTCLFLGRVNNP